MADRDQIAAADEQMGLAELDPVADHLGGAGDDEQAVAVALQLGPLVGLAGILDGQGVEAELALDDAQLLFGRLQQADPDDMALASGPFARPRRCRCRRRAAPVVGAGGDQAAALVRV